MQTVFECSILVSREIDFCTAYQCETNDLLPTHLPSYDESNVNTYGFASAFANSPFKSMLFGRSIGSPNARSHTNCANGPNPY